MSKEFFKFPAPVDPHVHLRDLGQEQKETFDSGTRAALAGGYTTVFDMPNKLKPILTLEDLHREIEVAQPQLVCDVGFYFGTDGKNLEQFKRVAQEAMGLKVYLNETTGNLIVDLGVLESIYRAWPENAGLILLHAEKESVPYSLAIVEKIRKRTHYCHVSTQKDMQAIIKAKEKGLPITCGVTPHHLFLIGDDVKRLGALAEMKPPLGTKTDRDFLWENLDSVDVIESDHAPHTLEEKRLAKPPSGVPGLETMLPLMLNAVKEGKLTLTRLIELISINPRKILGIPETPDTYTEVDLSKRHVIDASRLESKAKWTPFDGMDVTGKVEKVVLRGRVVFDGKSIAPPPSGMVIYPK